MDIIVKISQLAACITSVAAALALFIKPIRERLFKIKKDNEHERDGLRCLLRNEILKIYYRGRDTKTLTQYEAENFMHLYEAYTNLGGNSFIIQVHDEIISWKITKQ